MDHPIRLGATRRHPIGRGYNRGAEARARIIRIAIEAFGTYGYDGISTRAIAKKAGINAPALQYYFGGKKGLYLACADYIATTISNRLAPSLKLARDALGRIESRRNDQKLIGCLHKLLMTILGMLFEPSTTEAWALFVLREQAYPTAAFDGIFENIQGPVLRICAKLIGRLEHLPDNDPRVTLTALALYGQIISFRFARASVLRSLKTKKLTEHHLREVGGILLRQLASFAGRKCPKKASKLKN